MTKLVTLGANATSPIDSGSVTQFENKTNSVTVTDSNGNTERLATRADANISINLDTYLPDKDKDSPSIKVNGSPVFLALDNVVNDIDITNGGANKSLDQA